MIFTRLAHRVFAVAMIATFGLTSLVQARPMPSNVFVQQDEKKKLPPVNWVRSRTIDVKHLDIDLRFDWDKEQAIGTVVITFAPFADTDRFTLDAGAMTIDSVSLADGGSLKFSYDEKKTDDNLEILLGGVHKGGEDVRVKIDYKTNHKNVADNDTPIGSVGRGLRFIKPTPSNYPSGFFICHK